MPIDRSSMETPSGAGLQEGQAIGVTPRVAQYFGGFDSMNYVDKKSFKSETSVFDFTNFKAPIQGQFPRFYDVLNCLCDFSNRFGTRSRLCLQGCANVAVNIAQIFWTLSLLPCCIQSKISEQCFQLNPLVRAFSHAKIDLTDAIYEPDLVFV